ncbi:MAG: 23S rRNA (guanosine(2251)-2'-O)-methyltransferase RlmB [Halioglobus sp.]|nr:23S rRNA (guanosine(2251)-2'-O)-methyltransferase RlmB [Halioglobus sp.]
MEYVYGIHTVESLLRRKPKSVQCLLLQVGRADKRIAALLELAQNQGVAVLRESRSDLDAMVSGRHQGVVARMSADALQRAAAASNVWFETDLLQIVDNKKGPVLILVLDGITDPHNLGACLRSADGAGVDAVVVPKDNSADLTAVVSKVACGAAEVVPFVRVTNITRTLKALQERGVWLYGADGNADKIIYNSDLKGSVALIMGAEGSGMRRLTRDQCDHLIHLPMAGSVGSLNVSVAAGIFLFEVVRQRSASDQ